MRKEQWLEGWSKRNERAPVDLEATILRPDGRTISVRLANISAEGCQILCGETLPIGEMMTLSCKEIGDVSAQVRWSLAGRTGIYFSNLDDGSAHQERLSA